MVKSQGYFPSYVRNITSSNDDIRNMIDAELQGQRQQICLCHGVRRLTIPFCFRRPLSMHVACQNVIRPWQWKGWPSVVCATKIPTNYFELNNQTDDHMYYHCIISVLPLYYFCTTIILFMYYRYIISVLLLYYFCITIVLFLYYHYIISHVYVVLKAQKYTKLYIMCEWVNMVKGKIIKTQNL